MPKFQDQTQTPSWLTPTAYSHFKCQLTDENMDTKGSTVVLKGVIGWKFVSKSGTMFKIHHLPRQVVCVFQTNALCEGFGRSGAQFLGHN